MLNGCQQTCLWMAAATNEPSGVAHRSVTIGWLSSFFPSGFGIPAFRKVNKIQNQSRRQWKMLGTICPKSLSY